MWADRADYLVFSLLQKVVFLYEPIFYNIDTLSYYGTLMTPLGDEFVNGSGEVWDIIQERRLYYRLSSLGLVRSIASLFPTGDKL